MTEKRTIRKICESKITRGERMKAMRNPEVRYHYHPTCVHHGSGTAHSKTPGNCNSCQTTQKSMKNSSPSKRQSGRPKPDRLRIHKFHVRRQSCNLSPLGQRWHYLPCTRFFSDGSGSAENGCFPGSSSTTDMSTNCHTAHGYLRKTMVLWSTQRKTHKTYCLYWDPSWQLLLYQLFISYSLLWRNMHTVVNT